MTMSVEKFDHYFALFAKNRLNFVRKNKQKLFAINRNPSSNVFRAFWSQILFSITMSLILILYYVLVKFWVKTGDW